MMQSLDQWAFSIMLSLYAFFGVQDIPKVIDEDWTVTSRWELQSDQTYKLEIRSSTAVEKCKTTNSSFLIFPQTYFGKQEVYIDDNLIYANSYGESWRLLSAFNKPIVPCLSVVNGHEIRFVSSSYIQFFNSIAAYPQMVEHWPADIFFYTGVYLVAMSVCICLGIIGCIFLASTESKANLFIFFMPDVMFLILMFCFSAGVFYPVNVYYVHPMSVWALWGGFLFYLAPYFMSQKKMILTFVGLTALIFFCIGHRYLTQSIIIFGFPVAVFSQALVILIQLRSNEYMWHERILNIFILIAGVDDIYKSHIAHTGHFHLSLIIIMLAIVKFIKVVRRSQEKEIKMSLIEKSLSSEREMVGKISSFYESYRQIVHDLKSPITAISFFLNKENIDVKSINLVKGQIGEILSRIHGDEIKSLPDWYSVSLLLSKIEEVMELKRRIYEGKINFSSLIDISDKSLNAFFDPIDFQIILGELIDNTFKAIERNVGNINIKIGIDSRTELLNITYTDDGPGLSQEIKQNINYKGFTKSGTGMGLYGISNRLKSWNAAIDYTSNSAHGFVCNISLKVKQPS